MTRLYKLLERAEWAKAQARGTFAGSAVDLADGYIHLSAADQLGDTARLHFRGRPDLVLLVIEAQALGPALQWEPSRGGALFPHLYGPLSVDQVAEARPAPLGVDGVPDVGRAEP